MQLINHSSAIPTLMMISLRLPFSLGQSTTGGSPSGALDDAPSDTSREIEAVQWPVIANIDSTSESHGRGIWQDVLSGERRMRPGGSGFETWNQSPISGAQSHNVKRQEQDRGTTRVDMHGRALPPVGRVRRDLGNEEFPPKQRTLRLKRRAGKSEVSKAMQRTADGVSDDLTGRSRMEHRKLKRTMARSKDPDPPAKEEGSKRIPGTPSRDEMAEIWTAKELAEYDELRAWKNRHARLTRAVKKALKVPRELTEDEVRELQISQEQATKYQRMHRDGVKKLVESGKARPEVEAQWEAETQANRDRIRNKYWDRPEEERKAEVTRRVDDFRTETVRMRRLRNLINANQATPADREELARLEAKRRPTTPRSRAQSAQRPTDDHVVPLHPPRNEAEANKSNRGRRRIPPKVRPDPHEMQEQGQPDSNDESSGAEDQVNDGYTPPFSMEVEKENVFRRTREGFRHVQDVVQEAIREGGNRFMQQLEGLSWGQRPDGITPAVRGGKMRPLLSPRIPLGFRG